MLTFLTVVLLVANLVGWIAISYWIVFLPFFIQVGALLGLAIMAAIAERKQGH